MQTKYNMQIKYNYKIYKQHTVSTRHFFDLIPRINHTINEWWGNDPRYNTLCYKCMQWREDMRIVLPKIRIMQIYCANNRSQLLVYKLLKIWGAICNIALFACNHHVCLLDSVTGSGTPFFTPNDHKYIFLFLKNCRGAGRLAHLNANPAMPSCSSS